MEQVKIIAAETWGLQNGLFDKEKGWSMVSPVLDSIFFVVKGRKEYVVLADEAILHALKALPSDSYLGQKLSVVEKYLTSNGIEYTKVD